MPTRKMARFSAVAIVGIIMCGVTTEAKAQLAPALTAPLSCTLTLAGAQLTIETVPMGTPPTFPNDVPCTGGTGTCSEFNYRFTYAGGNISQSFLSVSSDVGIFEASPSGSIEVASCSGDSSTKVGLNVCEQRQVRFNDAAATVNAKVVVTRAATRVSTAGAKKGASEAYCLIQGPGAPGGSLFEPFTTSKKEMFAGGKLAVTVTFGPDNKPNGGACDPVQAPGITCIETTIGTGNPLVLNGVVIQDFDTITSGTGTSTCVKGNPTRCYCTAAPCP